MTIQKLLGGGPYVRINEEMFKKTCNLGRKACVPIALNTLGINKDIVKELYSEVLVSHSGIYSKDTVKKINEYNKYIRENEPERIIEDNGDVYIHKRFVNNWSLEDLYNYIFSSFDNGYATIISFIRLNKSGHMSVVAKSLSGNPYILSAQQRKLYKGKKEVLTYLSKQKISFVKLFINGLKLRPPTEFSPIKVDPINFPPERLQSFTEPIITEEELEQKEEEERNKIPYHAFADEYMSSYSMYFHKYLKYKKKYLDLKRIL